MANPTGKGGFGDRPQDAGRPSFRREIARIGSLVTDVEIPGIGKLNKTQRVVMKMFDAAEAGSESAAKFLASHLDGSKAETQGSEEIVIRVERE